MNRQAKCRHPSRALARPLTRGPPGGGAEFVPTSSRDDREERETRRETKGAASDRELKLVLLDGSGQVLGDVDSLPQLIAEARQKRMDKEAAEASRAEEGRAAASMAVASVDHTSSEEAPNKKLLPTSSSITPASSSDYNTF